MPSWSRTRTIDHLNRWSLRAIPREAHLVVPRGCKAIVDDLGFSRVTEVRAGDQLAIGDLQVEAVGTRHDNGRWKKTELPECVGYVVTGGGAIHHAGDVDFSDHSVFDDIGKVSRSAATLLPIGGMFPVFYYRNRRHLMDQGIHIDPDCALDIYERLGARSLVPIHWGTLHLRFGLPSMPRRRLAKIVAERKARRSAASCDTGRISSYAPRYSTPLNRKTPITPITPITTPIE